MILYIFEDEFESVSVGKKAIDNAVECITASAKDYMPEFLICDALTSNASARDENKSWVLHTRYPRFLAAIALEDYTAESFPKSPDFR